jgi:acyl carrier protein phosphodiesterase
MNWLAHLYLSEPNAQFRVGNLLPDMTSVAQLTSLPEPYQRGILAHRQIDLFTDAHPRVKSCVRRFPPPHRRFGGILTDVYFDYLLARNWSEYSTVPLRDFISGVYQDIEACLAFVPREARQRLQNMRQEDWLGSYHLIAGVKGTLERIGYRFRRPVNITGSLPFFQAHETAFFDDFQIFFPELIAHMQQRSERDS